MSFRTGVGRRTTTPRWSLQVEWSAVPRAVVHPRVARSAGARQRTNTGPAALPHRWPSHNFGSPMAAQNLGSVGRSAHTPLFPLRHEKQDLLRYLALVAWQNSFGFARVADVSVNVSVGARSHEAAGAPPAARRAGRPSRAGPPWPPHEADSPARLGHAPERSVLR